MSIFQNKVIWITGASSGIGEALAKAFAAKGARLILSARNVDRLNTLRESLSLPESHVLILPLDLAETSNVSSLVQSAISKFKAIDILINNGGISQRANAIDTTLETDRKIMEVNFFGTVALTKAVLPEMIRQQRGHIVVVSSIAGKFGFYLRSAYSASKHALHGFFESLRMEIEPAGVKVLIVCPGKIRTNISVNAVTGHGQTHGKKDDSTEKGMTADECARQILRGIESNKEEIFIGGSELKAIWIKRLFPGLFSKMIKKQKPE